MSKSRHYLTMNVRNGTRYIATMEWTYTCPTKGVISNDLEWVSEIIMTNTWSNARSLCDSWASCWTLQRCLASTVQWSYYRILQRRRQYRTRQSGLTADIMITVTLTEVCISWVLSSIKLSMMLHHPSACRRSLHMKQLCMQCRPYSI